MKNTLLLFLCIFSVTLSYAQQHHVVLIKYPPKSKGITCTDAMMSQASFATVKEAVTYERNMYKENNSSSISTYRIRDKEVGIIYEWKYVNGNRTCIRIAVAIGADETAAMKTIYQKRVEKQGVNIIGYLNTAGIKI